VSIYGDRNEDKYFPTMKIGDCKYFVGRGAGKLPTLIPRPVDILSCLALALNKKKKNNYSYVLHTNLSLKNNRLFFIYSTMNHI
jgi:hypothetical protein